MITQKNMREDALNVPPTLYISALADLVPCKMEGEIEG